ncbi:hypothetical protein [Campylobacter gastrosuis]|uniref:Uncharacterized protein n=1 Tax=Campylobacter gastrosuis TaxID=2974576 RepID=A0ABT7HNK4_9BACT|nr:hypothetical protein [Campylobacter gastrosuis]MDL0088507.1 hypothetical protein [Campylobacter gastrosuis]
MSSPEREKQAKALNELAKFCDKQEQAKRVSKNELKDVAIISLAFSMLKSDICDKFFINKATTDKIDFIRQSCDDILKFYRNDKSTIKRVCLLLDALDHKMKANKTEVTTTATQCALTILYFTLAPNERKQKPLNPNLAAFWLQIKDSVLDVLYTATDKAKRYEDYAVDSDILAQFVKDNI